jgi:hypothetical protein
VSDAWISQPAKKNGRRGGIYLQYYEDVSPCWWTSDPSWLEPEEEDEEEVSYLNGILSKGHSREGGREAGMSSVLHPQDGEEEEEEESNTP